MPELITARPNIPMSEEWRWDADVMTSFNGTEQRVDNAGIPRRIIGGQYEIFDQSLINALVMGLARAKGLPIHAPFFQYETKLTASIASGVSVLPFIARRSELRGGDFALIYDDNDLAFELVQINVVSSSSSTIIAPTTSAWPAGSLISPVHLMVAGSGLTVQRHRVDGLASIDLALREVGFHSPFINPFNDTALPLYSGLPLLADKPVGDQFDEEIITGSIITDYGGLINVDSDWDRTKEQFTRRYYCRRIMQPADWEFWFKFGDAVRGAAKPFWMPSYRADYSIITPPAPSGNQLTLGGHFFRDYCFPFVGRKSLFIESDGGMHYATATVRTDLGANDRVTFSPALPAGATYGLNQKIGILHRCRLADSKISWQHFSAHSIAELSIITTDE